MVWHSQQDSPNSARKHAADVSRADFAVNARYGSVIESEPEPSVTEPLLLTVATDCGDESRGVRVDCAAHAVAKDSRSRALISSNLGRPRRRCATRALNLSGSQTIFSPPLSRLPPSPVQ